MTNCEVTRLCSAPCAPRKMMQGCSLTAREKTACTSFWESPNHLLCSEPGLTHRK